MALHWEQSGHALKKIFIVTRCPGEDVSSAFAGTRDTRKLNCIDGAGLSLDIVVINR
jgi:hypothetical protein